MNGIEGIRRGLRSGELSTKEVVASCNLCYLSLLQVMFWGGFRSKEAAFKKMREAGINDKGIAISEMSKEQRLALIEVL